MNSVQFNPGAKKGATAAVLDDPVEQETQAINKTFKSMNPNHTFRTLWMFFPDLVIDPRIQRAEEPAEINKMVSNWHPAAIGTLVGSRRPDGTIAVLDGQQRRAAGLKLGYAAQVQVIVHEGLSLAEEAELFLLLNDRRSVNSWTQFRISRTAGDPVAQAIGLILDELHIGLGGPKGFSAVVMARRVAKRTGGLTNLQWALRQVQSIYDPAGEGGVYDGRVVEAFAMLHRYCGEHNLKVDENNLHHKLARHGGGLKGLDGLVGHGHTVQTMTGGRIAKAIANAVVVRYNTGKSKDSPHALPMIP